MIHISSDYSGILDAIDVIGRQPTEVTEGLLNAVLAMGHAAVVVDTHVDTGSLKSSMTKDSSSDASSQTWEGTIKAGGPSAGVNNPVDYAIYEQRRGGAHDFFASLPTLHPAYIAAVLKGMSS